MSTKTTARRKSVSRKEITAQALVLASEIGWHKLTVRSLAQKLGYAPPVLYAHFDSKDHLMHTLISEGFEEMSRLMHTQVAYAHTPAEKLVQVALARLRFASAHKALHSLMFSTNCSCGQQQAILEGICAARNLVKQLLQAITGRTDDCQELITQFVALVRGYSYIATELPNHLSKSEFFPDLAPEEALSRAVRRFITSIQIQL